MHVFERWGNRGWQIAAVLACFAALGAVLWLGAFHWPEPVESGTPAATAAENSSKRTATLAVLAGLIALGGLVVSVSNYRRQAKHDAHVHEKDRLDGVHQRYSTAIEHLGSENPAVQAAAVYALEDVIKADPARRVAIVQTLMALVVGVRAAAQTSEIPDVRVVAAQLVIARNRGGLGGPPAWLPRTDLRSMDLRRSNLAYADFSNASLAHSNLAGVELHCATLDTTNLSYVNLATANLTNARLSSAKLFNADLTDVNLMGAELIHADLSYANLAYADLTDAKVDRVYSWNRTNVWGVKGVPEGWCPSGAILVAPSSVT